MARDAEPLVYESLVVAGALRGFMRKGLSLLAVIVILAGLDLDFVLAL
jgi:hypothetical protein